MALRGTIENFGLAGVLQLIGQNSRHGVLTLEHLAEQVNLFFAGGELVRAETSGGGQGRQEALATLLLRAQVVTQEQLQAAAAAQGESGASLLEALTQAGASDAMTLAAMVRLHSVETVVRAFVWQQGTYAFLPATSPPRAQHDPVRADHLLMEALTQADGWPALKRQVPSFAAVYGVSRSLEDYLITATMQASTRLKSDLDDAFSMDMGDDAAAADAEASPGGISHEARVVYSLVDGERTVQEMIDLSRLGAFATVRCLCQLLDAQVVAHKPAATVAARGDKAKVPARRRTQLPIVWRHLGQDMWRDGWRLGLGLALSACLMAQAGFPGLQGIMARATNLQASAAWTRLVWQNQAPFLMHSLALSRARDGAYPKALVPGPDVPAQAWYARQEAGYLLRLALPADAQP